MDPDPPPPVSLADPVQWASADNTNFSQDKHIGLDDYRVTNAQYYDYLFIIYALPVHLASAASSMVIHAFRTTWVYLWVVFKSATALLYISNHGHWKSTL